MNNMAKPNWKKSFRKVPDPIIRKVSKIPGANVMAACVKKIPASVLRSGTYKHLGMRMNGNSPEFPSRLMPQPKFGPCSLRNAQGEEIVRKDLPMRTKTYSFDAPNWGDWSNGTHEVSWDRQVYQREFVPPKELEISITLLATEASADPVFVFRFRVEEVLNKRAADFEKALLFNLNLLQENTGAADVFAADADPTQYLNTISVHWEILPPGEGRDVLVRILSKFRDPGKELREKLEDRYSFLEKLKPVAYVSGTSGFQRYFGAKFADNLVVFENMEYGNAIYVMFEDWQELSKLSRLELLRDRRGAGFERIIHRKGWKDEVKRAVEACLEPA
jgi:hypothetical protein